MSSSDSESEPDLSSPYRPFLLQLRLTKEGFSDEAQRRAYGLLDPDALCLDDDEEELVDGFEAEKDKWMDDSFARVVIEERKAKLLEEAREEEGEKKRTRLQSMASSSQTSAKRKVVDSDDEMDEDEDLGDGQSTTGQSSRMRRAGPGQSKIALVPKDHRYGRPEKWKIAYPPDSIDKTARLKINQRESAARKKIKTKDWLHVYDLIPDDVRQQLPLEGPGSQAAIDLVLDRSTNTVKRPTSNPPSAEYSAAYHFVKNLLTFRSYHLNRSDYETPLGISYRTRWGGGDMLLLAANVRSQLMSKQKGWKVAKEELAVLGSMTPSGAYISRDDGGLMTPLHYSSGGRTPMYMSGGRTPYGAGGSAMSLGTLDEEAEDQPHSDPSGGWAASAGGGFF